MPLQGVAMAMMIKVIARFIDKASKKPLSGDDLLARLYDHDAVGDDLIGESRLDKNGTAEVVADLSAARSADSPLETRPDLYFSLANRNGVVFETPVFKDVDFMRPDAVSGENRSGTQDLGTFEV
jgi:hypothetical protein